MKHFFDVEIAKKLGINSAIILENMYFWIKKNEANKRHYYDGKYWTYNSVEAFTKIFPYLTYDSIRYALTKLEKDGYIITGNYNNMPMDKTKWYALTERSYCLLENSQMDLGLFPNGAGNFPKAIPDNKPDNKPDKDNVEQSSTLSTVKEIIKYLNEKANRNYLYSSADSKKHINARLNEGYTLSDFKKVIDIKVAEWGKDKKMSQYLRPSTLFGTKFESYLNQIPVKRDAISTPVSKEDKAKNPDGSYVVY